jgi:hypothetical protein
MLKADRSETDKSVDNLLRRLQEEKKRKKERAKALRENSLSSGGFSLDLSNEKFDETLNASASSFGSNGRKKKENGMGKYFEKSRKKDYLSYTLH